MEQTNESLGPQKKELSEKQKAKYERYAAIKANLNARGSTLTRQAAYIAQLNSARLRSQEEYEGALKDLEMKWEEEKGKKKANKNIGISSPAVNKTKKKKAVVANIPSLSNEEQLALLQKRIAFKGNAEKLYKNIYAKNATKVVRNQTKLNAILNSLSKGVNANTIKTNIKAKRNAITKKRLNTIASKKAVVSTPYNPFNNNMVVNPLNNNVDVPNSSKNVNPFNGL